MSARKVIVLLVVAVPIFFVSCLFAIGLVIGPSDPETPAERAHTRPGVEDTDGETWEYILEIAPILADDDWWDEEHKQYNDYLIEAYRIRFARPWSTATDDEIWEYVLEVQPLMTVTRNPDEDEIASLIESWRTHGAPRDATGGLPGSSATVEEIWDYFLDLDPSMVLTDSEIVASYIRQYLTEPEAIPCCPRSSGQDVPAGSIMRVQATLNANATYTAVATRQAVNTVVAVMNKPAGPITTPADLVARVENGVVRVAGGSGFIFDVIDETAFVATNHHVIDGMRNVEVVVKNYETYEALVLGWDVERDVAALSICCSHDFLALPWDPAAEMETGDSVVAIGYPQRGGLGVTTTVGEISESDVQNSSYDLILHTAPLNPGNSGGPLFSMPDGKVLGINTARGTESLGFYAVPFQAIEEQVAQWRSQLVVPR
ncbi:MAG: trypsin-like peptidase domain-containing protein [Chloroflexota bacterium]|nr:trypsin-like peptidase domain-containing protein [Chloroflexota bacterium]